MALTGIDAVVFGVADMAEAKRFLDDWGVSEVSATADRLVYRTRDGAEVIVRPKDASDLPPPIESRQHGARSHLGRRQRAGTEKDR